VGVTPASAFAAGTLAPAVGVRVCLGAADSLEQLRSAMEILAAVLGQKPATIRAYY
jgi:hypothetical protein